MAAQALGLPLAHVEAGLRTHDLRTPWPEEEFRVSIDAYADLLFAPPELSAANLRREKVSGAIHVTGNTAIDAVLDAAKGMSAAGPCADPPRLLVTCHRRESWGTGLCSIASALVELSADATIDFILHPNPAVASAMTAALSGREAVRLHQPSSHRAMLELMRRATLLLSDSGGIQEEAAALGTPLLVLRDLTERPEAIATGNMILVGTDTQRIVAETRRLLADRAALAAMARPAFPYGDGNSGPRIAALIADWLAEQKRARSR
jgi:UDP-N-acetylglucosamine 2-epimerase (non-hydrolysing)